MIEVQSRRDIHAACNKCGFQKKKKGPVARRFDLGPLMHSNFSFVIASYAFVLP